MSEQSHELPIYEGVRVRVKPMPHLPHHQHFAIGEVDRWIHDNLFVVELEGTCRGLRAFLYDHEMEVIA